MQQGCFPQTVKHWSHIEQGCALAGAIGWETCLSTSLFAKPIRCEHEPFETVFCENHLRRSLQARHLYPVPPLAATIATMRITSRVARHDAASGRGS